MHTQVLSVSGAGAAGLERAHGPESCTDLGVELEGLDEIAALGQGDEGAAYPVQHRTVHVASQTTMARLGRRQERQARLEQPCEAPARETRLTIGRSGGEAL